MSVADFDQVVEANHRALDAFARGDHEPLAKLWSMRDDVTLGNPFGPFVSGFDEVVHTMQRAASFYRDGEAVGFDLVAKHVTADLALLVEVERLSARMGGREDATPVALRTTSVFRNEGGAWKLMHRHADPITSARSADSVIQS
jgi:ketosteroid isomerase-like protein